jgi:NAD(P)H-dependent FMN reductase
MISENDDPGLTAEQIRAARALLDWSQPKLVEASKLSLPTIRRMEGPLGPGRSTPANVAAVRNALEAAGVIFLAAGEVKAGGPGVRLR